MKMCLYHDVSCKTRAERTVILSSFRSEKTLASQIAEVCIRLVRFYLGISLCNFKAKLQATCVGPLFMDFNFSVGVISALKQNLMTHLCSRRDVNALASIHYTCNAVIQAQGCVMTNKKSNDIIGYYYVHWRTLCLIEIC